MAYVTLAPYIAAANLGGCSWYVYFHKHEHHLYGLMYLGIFVSWFTGYFILGTRIFGQATSSMLISTLALSGSWLFGVYASMLFWRAFLNPLNRFPGPWAARMGNFWFTFQLGKADAYYKLKAMHDRYGRIVRIGSNDLSITDPIIMETAYGKASTVTKGSWYDNDAPLSSMHTTRDKKLHEKRRRIWAPAFSEKAVRDYETRISGLIDLLVTKIAAYKGTPANVKLWFNLFSFDAMSLLAFGKDYGMLESGQKHWALDLLDEGMQPLAYWLPPWFFRVLVKIPGAGAGYQKFVKFCVDELSWRVKNAKLAESKGGNDMMSWILRAYQDIDRPERDPLLQADARLIIVAGSDTTASALTYLFYHLAQHRDQVEKLRRELSGLTSGDFHDQDINQAQHLNGCIWEALRLHPPVPSGVSRLTPPQGIEADGKHIPGGTIFWMPQYVMGRDEKIYEDADSFVPERWYSSPGMVKNQDAWAPFSVSSMKPELQ